MTIYNFSAGPAGLPAEVLAKAKNELQDWSGLGTSVMEISHRSKAFIDVADKAEFNLRQLLSVPNNYKVLFLQGGGRGQFFSVPMNLAKRGKLSQHLISGHWSKSALEEAGQYMDTQILAESFTKDLKIVVPTQSQWQIDPQAAYMHYCPNETVDGVEIDWVIESNEVPVVADMSSNILSKAINVEDYGIIYASAQKNIGPSGLAVVIVRDDLLDCARDDTPSIFSYAKQSNADSMYNTPPTFSWYLAGLVFEWLLEKGGLSKVEAVNRQKSDYLYQCIDKSNLYANHVHEDYRSKMNVTFHLADDTLNTKFLEAAEHNGLRALKGHRQVGGMRASIYNAMDFAGVSTLVEFMQEFERTQA
jgi:phosphoserine aminotransferase